jgi:hypothetical protein
MISAGFLRNPLALQTSGDVAAGVADRYFARSASSVDSWPAFDAIPRRFSVDAIDARLELAIGNLFATHVDFL